MVIDLDTFKEIIEKTGLDANEFIYLCFLNDGGDLTFLTKIKESSEISLISKGWLFAGSGDLTPKAISLLKSLPKQVENSKKEHISSNYAELHRKLQDKLFFFKKKKQIEGFGGVYFIPTVKELEQFLTRFWKEYPEYKDIVKIENILLNHIEKCCKNSSFAPAIKYFIIKDKVGSQLANAYENYTEGKKEVKQTFDI